MRALLEPLAEMLGDVVASQLRQAFARPRYYTARTSPLPGKAFLAAAREGAFPSFVVKKRIYAICDDVHAWMEAAPRRAPERDDARGDDEIGELLDTANLRRARR